MDAATTQWPQGINGVVKPVDQKKPRPQKEQAVHCPRCSSTNTKFCYYNNYSLSQPRYFCKTCRRYWTEGGSLRNVPVGGGSRKNKRSSSSPCNINTSSSSSSSSKKAIADNAATSNFLPQNPNTKFHGGHDLNLSYNPSQYDGMSEFMVPPSFGVLDAKNMEQQNPITACSSASHVPVMELLKSTGNIGSMGLGSLLSAPVSDSDSSMFPSISFPWHDQFNPSLNFSLNGLDQNNGFGNMQGADQAHCANTSRNNIFPNFEELKPVSNTDDQLEQDRVQGEDHSNGFNWNGMLAGGSW